MKSIRILVIASLSILSVSGYSQDTSGNKMNVQTQSKDSIVYTCPMHPEIVSAKPGKCPKCGMDLVQKKIKPEVKKLYTCGMHPDYISEKPGRCPTCGMTLVEKRTAVEKKD